MNDIYIEVPYDVFKNALDQYREEDNHWRLSTDAPLRYKDNPLFNLIESTPVHTLFDNKVHAKYSLYLIYGMFITHTITE